MTQPDRPPEDPWAWLKALGVVIGGLIVLLLVVYLVLYVFEPGQPTYPASTENGRLPPQASFPRTGPRHRRRAAPILLPDVRTT